MENEIMTNDQMTTAIQQIQVIQGSVVFGGYDELRRQATDLANNIRTVEVTEDNVKISKKLLASVNKRLKELEDKRISIKKTMLEPYQEFEEQVKDIVGIVKDADGFVRDQVNELERIEREEKGAILKDLFDKRKQAYSFGDLLDFVRDFFKAKHLNKTTTIDSVEKEMVVFLEQIEKDTKVIEKMDKSNDLFYAYMETFDLADAMTRVQKDTERKEQIEQVKKKQKPTNNQTEKIGFLVSVQVRNKKELTLIEMILQEHGFEYTTDKVEF